MCIRDRLWYNPTKENIFGKSDTTSVDPLDMIEMQNALKKTTNRKAPGLDNVNSEMIKYGGLFLHRRMLHLFNICWTSYEIPAEWKSANVISLFKRGERNKTENNRGISLLNAAYKLYSRISNERLRTISKTILLEDRAGFRKG